MSGPSSSLRIGISGFGRLGRLVLRQAVVDCVNVVAINDPLLGLEKMAYLFQYDSSHGPFKGTVTVNKADKELLIDGHVVKVLSGTKPSEIEWRDAGAEYIIECSGEHTTFSDAVMHKKGGAHKVIVAGHSLDAHVLVCGVNLRSYKSSMLVVSMSTATTQCLAPLMAVIVESFDVVSGCMTTVQSVSRNQKTVDCRSRRLWRHGRSCVQNIIPVANGAAKTVGKIIPKLKGKLTGMALRVPTADVSVIDLTLCMAGECSYEQIVTKVKEASEAHLRGIVTCTEHEAVSMDFKGNTHSCVLDVEAGLSLDETLFKLVAWYDQETGYAKRLIELALYMHDKDLQEEEDDDDLY